jgi:hypothetical protein
MHLRVGPVWLVRVFNPASGCKRRVDQSCMAHQRRAIRTNGLGKFCFEVEASVAPRTLPQSRESQDQEFFHGRNQPALAQLASRNIQTAS